MKARNIEGQTQTDLEDYLESHPKGKRLTADGREVLDSTPMAPPIGFKRTPSLAEQIRAMIRSEKLAEEARSAGAETFEEADDFEVGDDYDPTSPYEADFDPTPIAELKRRHQEELAAVKASRAPQPAPKPNETTPPPVQGGDS